MAANCARHWIEHLVDEADGAIPPEWTTVTDLVNRAQTGSNEDQVFDLRTADIHALQIFEAR